MVDMRHFYNLRDPTQCGWFLPFWELCEKLCQLWCPISLKNHFSFFSETITDSPVYGNRFGVGFPTPS